MPPDQPPLVVHGDCLEVLTLQAHPDSIDSCVTDPPYGLKFMGRAWDHGVPGIPFWQAIFRVLKPGAHLLAFGGTRTYHRLVCAIEDAGFEVRDQMAWLYGSGFPKSHDFAGKIVNDVRVIRPEFVGHPQAQGWGTALKPAHEPIVLARKPLSERNVAANVLRWGTGAVNVDGSRVAGRERTEYGLATAQRSHGSVYGEPSASADFDASKGRWPPNLLHDGSPEVLEAFARFGESKSKQAYRGLQYSGRHGGLADNGPNPREGTNSLRGHSDAGTAARFFPALGFSEEELRFHYAAKASKVERAGSKHPTIKPLALMRWLCRLITPPGGTVLDPFAGSGTTGEAALLEGFRPILIENDPQYISDIHARIARASLTSPSPL